MVLRAYGHPVRPGFTAGQDPFQGGRKFRQPFSALGRGWEIGRSVRSGSRLRRAGVLPGVRRSRLRPARGRPEPRRARRRPDARRHHRRHHRGHHRRYVCRYHRRYPVASGVLRAFQQLSGPFRVAGKSDNPFCPSLCPGCWWWVVRGWVTVRTAGVPTLRGRLVGERPAKAGRCSCPGWRWHARRARRPLPASRPLLDRVPARAGALPSGLVACSRGPGARLPVRAVAVLVPSGRHGR